MDRDDRTRVVVCLTVMTWVVFTCAHAVVHGLSGHDGYASMTHYVYMLEGMFLSMALDPVVRLIIGKMSRK